METLNCVSLIYWVDHIPNMPTLPTQVVCMPLPYN